MQKQITKAIKQNAKEIIPIFFSTDNNYVPYLSVALRSLIDNASNNYQYEINILTTGVEKDRENVILSMGNENFDIKFVDISKKISPIVDKLGEDFYFTIATYFRLFIASMFPQYKKAIYLDCDIVVLGDISKFYKTELKDNILGVVSDQIIECNEVFKKYVEEVIGLSYKDYFNAGILLINLEEYRKQQIEKKFLDILKKYNFVLVANDQDYLNYLCKGKTKLLERSWNKECMKDGNNNKPNIVHYAFFKKPWNDFSIKFGKYFWQYAKKVPFYKSMIEYRKNFDKSKQVHMATEMKRIVQKALDVMKSGHYFTNRIDHSNDE